MKKALIGTFLLVLLGGVVALSMHQSARLHGVETLMDGIRFVRIRSAEVWGDVPLPVSLPDVTAEALAADVFPRSWQAGQHPFGGAVRIGRWRAGENDVRQAHILLTLFAVPADVCARLLPRLREEMAHETVRAIWIADEKVTGATVCSGDAATTWRIALATRTPP